jgi:hypothetical protein
LTIFSSNEINSWQADGERGIGGGALFLTIVFLFPRKSQSAQAGKVSPPLWFGFAIAETLLGQMIAYAVELRGPAQLIKRHFVVLMRLDMGVIQAERQIPAIHQYVL